MSSPSESSPNTRERLDAAFILRSKTGRESTDLVIDYLLDGLIDGSILPGERLNAKKLVEQLDVSVVPIREAIHFLAGEGVIELLPLKGARIREMNAEEVVEWWKVIGAITKLCFEPAVGALVSDSEKSKLVESSLAAIESKTAPLDAVDYLMAQADFYRTLTYIGKQTILEEAMRRIQTVYWLTYLPRYLPFDIYADDFTAHTRHVSAAMLRGDAQSAKSAFTHLVDWSSAIIRGARPTPGAPWVQQPS